MINLKNSLRIVLYLALTFSLFAGCKNKKELDFKTYEGIITGVNTEGFKIGDILSIGDSGQLIKADAKDFDNVIGFVVGKEKPFDNILTTVFKIFCVFIIVLVAFDVTKYIISLIIDFIKSMGSIISTFKKVDIDNRIITEMEIKTRKVLSSQYVRILKYERSQFSQANDQIIETNLYIDTLKRQLECILYHPEFKAVKITASNNNFKGRLIVFFYNCLLYVAVKKYGSGYKLDQIVKDLVAECIKNVKMVNYENIV